jgi:hypothetical protein
VELFAKSGSLQTCLYKAITAPAATVTALASIRPSRALVPAAPLAGCVWPAAVVVVVWLVGVVPGAFPVGVLPGGRLELAVVVPGALLEPVGVVLEPEPEPGPELLALVGVPVPETDSTPFAIVGTVTQLDDDGVNAAVVGVTVVPTVYDTGMPLEV